MRIQGLGVIDEASIELHRGLTVVTGETGAGKTMVVTGLHLLSGGRAEVSRVRTGVDRAVVEGRFHTPAGSPAAEVAANAGADPDEDGSLIAVRTVSTDGRSRAHLGGRSVPVGVLAEISEQLIAVHGQNDQLRLARPTEQRAVLDRFAGDAVAEPLGRYKELRDEWVAVSAELVERTEKSREMAREADLLKHGLAEIEAVDPKPGEDDDLHAEARRLADVDQLREAAQGAQYSLSGEADAEVDAVGALGMIAEARRRFSSTEDPKLRDLEPRLAEASVLLTDVATELVGYLESLDADPARLEQVLARQQELKQLTRKYAADVDGVLEWARVSQERLAGLDTSEEALAELARRREELAAQLAGVAKEVTAERTVSAEDLGKAVTEELAGLAMAQSRVEVAVLPRPAEPDDSVALDVDGQRLHAGREGVDDVELRLIAHPGAPALPVNKGASGGELSRVMLALEVVLSHADPVPTLVFDEVDAGIGGEAAIQVGLRLKALGARHQVLVVTHLAQIASFADHHLLVEKSPGIDGRNVVSVRELTSDEDRAKELARMMSGGVTPKAMARARELLEEARR